MSLSHSKYLITLDSERRHVAVFHSISIQHQIDMMHKDIHVLFDMVERILAIQEGHEKEHAAMYSVVAPTAAADNVAGSTGADQSNSIHRSRDRDHHNPYL